METQEVIAASSEVQVNSGKVGASSSGLLDMDWKSIQEDNFWEVADNIQDNTLDRCKQMFSRVQYADPETLRSILLQYRFFTVYYIPDLALLISRLHDGEFRSFLADILFDELGMGDPNKAHPKLYDDFLRTIGFDGEDLNQLSLSSNAAILNDARKALVDPSNSSAFGVGLRGMGGECICQVYIAQLYEYLILNPYIRENKDKIDWRFWDLHVGEHDVEHRIQTRALIDSQFVRGSGDNITELGRGYSESISSWNTFWENIFDAADAGFDKAEFCAVRPTANVSIIQ